MKIYLQTSVLSVLLCGALTLVAFASDSVSVMEEPPAPEISVPEEVYHGETPILFPDPDLLIDMSGESSDASEEITQSSLSSSGEGGSSAPVSESTPESSAESSAAGSESSSAVSSALPSSMAGSSSEVSSSAVSSSSSAVSSSSPVSSTPSSQPGNGPEDAPVIDPPSSSTPAVSSAPSSQPSSVPASEPSSAVSSEPSAEPSVEPSSEPSSKPLEPSGPSYTTSSSSSAPSSSVSPSRETVRAIVNGKTQEVELYDYLCRTVEAEMGAFHAEALKAQAVAAYSYIRYENARGAAVSLPLRTPSQKTKDAVRAVLGEAVYYNGKVAFTPYYASSAGWTNPSSEVWGGSYSYLTRVESIHDPSSNNKNVKAVFSEEKIRSGLEKFLDIDLEGSDPEEWLNIVSVSDSGYVLKVEITDADGEVHTVTGRQVRESILAFGIRSHAFTVTYENGTFTFITNGYGHGCGMSQTGANGYAQDGWSYVEILNHYYPGTTVR